MKPQLSLGLAISLAGCASTGSMRPTADLYTDVIATSAYAFHCAPSELRAFRARLEPLMPWLESELGREHVAELVAEIDADWWNTDFAHCPAAQDRRLAHAKLDRLVKHWKSRTRR